MSEPFDLRCAKLIANLGLAGEGEVLAVKPLTGGVASDIAVVSLPGREICVKFALPKLKVAEDWRAPVHRNKAEYAWLMAAAACAPENVPALYGWSPADNGFAMEYLTGESVYLWKDALLKSAPDQGEAEAVASVLGRIHAASTVPGFDQSPFRNRDDFYALRLEPYLNFTASKHPDLAPQLSGLVDSLYAADSVLVHGDVSPKNILFRNGTPIILDAECATMGDASFDLAFCLNHLILKALHLPASRRTLSASVLRFWARYEPEISWEDPTALEARVTALLPALMLARVDGKSPVEYLSEQERGRVRRLAIPLIAGPARNLTDLITVIDKD
ncbi:phosphotransferase family protein [Denitrobaculum tricleocarpae]|uniref:phosphotransferase family protein n=1 Tax=Denitrobaculum tricleocarpae TaxID=2591009 RepID=UPI0015D23BF1|nr:aminoglycoside phosphotransferase family protein [Denitrobaculum tricleocarpae]